MRRNLEKNSKENILDKKSFFKNNFSKLASLSLAFLIKATRS